MLRNNTHIDRMVMSTLGIAGKKTFILYVLVACYHQGSLFFLIFLILGPISIEYQPTSYLLMHMSACVVLVLSM